MNNSDKLFNKMVNSRNLTKDDVSENDESVEILPGDFKPKFYDDIKISLLFEDTNPEVYCVGTVESDNYLKIDKNKLEFMETLINITDGEKTIDEIGKTLCSIYAISSYRSFYTMLGQYGLLKNYKLKKKSDLNIFSISLFSLNISKFCLSISAIVPMIISIFKVAYLFIFSVLLGLIIAKIIDPFTMFNVENSSFIETILVTLLYIIPTIVTHEFSHMIVAIKHKLHPNQLKVSLYMLIYPLIYVVIPGIYFVKRKERIWILSAGLIWNSFFMMLSIIIGNIFSINIFKEVAYSNLIVIAINLIPFFLSDGYFILCNLMKTSNIRKDFSLFIMSFVNKSIDRKKIFKSKFSVFYIIMSTLFLLYGMYGLGSNFTSWFYNFLYSRWSIELNESFFIPMSISSGTYVFFLLMLSTNMPKRKKKPKKRKRK